MNKKLAGLTIAFLLSATGARAEERATTKDAELLVHRAVATIKKDGAEKAIAAFNEPKGPFTYRDLYIVVLDLKGVMRANGARPDLVGKNELGRKDSTGKLMTLEMVNLGKDKGSGWVEYRWDNPVNGQNEVKVAYVERVGELIVVCGAFKPVK